MCVYFVVYVCCMCDESETQCAITCFGYHTTWIDGVNVVYFLFTHFLGRPCYMDGVSVLCRLLRLG